MKGETGRDELGRDEGGKEGKRSSSTTYWSRSAIWNLKTFISSGSISLCDGKESSISWTTARESSGSSCSSSSPCSCSCSRVILSLSSCWVKLTSPPFSSHTLRMVLPRISSEDSSLATEEEGGGTMVSFVRRAQEKEGRSRLTASIWVLLLQRNRRGSKVDSLSDLGPEEELRGISGVERRRKRKP